MAIVTHSRGAVRVPAARAARNDFGKYAPWEFLPGAFRTVVIIVQ